MKVWHVVAVVRIPPPIPDRSNPTPLDSALFCLPLFIYSHYCTYFPYITTGRLYVQQNLLDHGATLVQWRPSEITIMELWVLLLTLKKHSISGLCEFKYGKDEKGENQAKTQ